MRMIRFAYLIILCLCFASGTYAADELEIKLSAYTVHRNQNGEDTFTTADKIKPGNTVEYRAIYRNISNRVVRNISANLPVPAEMEYIPASAQPKGFLASIDKKKFEPLPLYRTVKFPDGSVKRKEVSAAEYRAFQWKIDSLKPGESFTVKARTRLRSDTKK